MRQRDNSLSMKSALRNPRTPGTAGRGGLKWSDNLENTRTYTKGDEVGMITPADKSMLCTNSGIVPNSQSQTSWTPTFDVAAANATENMENMTAMASGTKSVSSDSPSSRARTPLSPRSPNVVATDLSFNSENAGHTPGTSLSFGSRKKRKNPNAGAKKIVTATETITLAVPTTSRIELADAAGSPVTPAGPKPASLPAATTTKLEMSPEATHVAFDGDGGDPGIPSPAPAGARAPANTPAAATMNDAGGPVAAAAAALLHSHSPTASQEDVVEEVKSWFASVHSKLDLALSAISPGGLLRATPARLAEKTPADEAEDAEGDDAEGGDEGKVESSPDALTASAQSPATLMGATGAVARLIEEALAAPDAPVFQPALSPVSTWMSRPKALVEALAEPLTPSPRPAEGKTTPGVVLAPLPEDCVTPIADDVTDDDRPGFTAADALVMDVTRPDALRVVATLLCAGLASTFPVAVATCALSFIVGALTSAFTSLFVQPPVEPVVAVVKGSYMIFPPFLARFVAMTETYLINVGAAMRSVPFDAAAAAAAAEEAERLAAIGRVSLNSEGLAILAVLLFSFASVAGAALLAMYPEGDVLRGVKEAFVEAKEMSSPATAVSSPAASGDVSWIADAEESAEECAASTATPAGASSGKTPRGAFMEQVENVSSKLGAIKRMIFADDGDEEVRCTAVVDELKLKLEARNRVARGMDAFPWMSYPPAKSPAAAEIW